MNHQNEANESALCSAEKLVVPVVAYAEVVVGVLFACDRHFLNIPMIDTIEQEDTN